MTIIQFKARQRKAQKKIIRCVDGIKYYSKKQIRLLRRTVKEKAERGNKTAIGEWRAMDLLTQTGLRCF